MRLTNVDEALTALGIETPTTAREWRDAAKKMDAEIKRLRQRASDLAKRAQEAGNRGHRIEDAARRAASWEAQVERGEVCPVAWKLQPVEGGTRAHVTDVRAGAMRVEGVAREPVLFDLRGGLSQWGSVRLGVVDVPATLTAWREFCARRKASEASE
jgi:hypothetical protein